MTATQEDQQYTQVNVTWAMFSLVGCIGSGCPLAHNDSVKGDADPGYSSTYKALRPAKRARGSIMRPHITHR